jgi:aerobic-type carbon monoxide dehydrogenase small subunit (CoxS/CutS family)
VTLVNVPPDRTLLEVLREDLGCTGTKEGCGEGDCGACTVVLGEAVDGRIEYRAINSCIRLAHSIDGMALWTVEDLAADRTTAADPSRDGRCTRRKRHGAVPRSQCGFCTPGFVMSLFGMYQNQVVPGQPVTREGAGSPVGQPVPLHRLPADPGRRAGWRYAAPRGGTKPNCYKKLERPFTPGSTRPNGLIRRLPAPQNLPSCWRARAHPRRRSWPAAPTSACG